MWEILPSITSILNELITGTVGGLVVAGGAFGLRIYKRKQIEAKFPIGGDYISFFEDVVDNEKVVVPSVSKVEQRGTHLRIVTLMDNERSWTLEGTIMQGGHVSGVYSADAVYDDGVGSFYLKISKNSLDGMWNGYDHENRMTNAGRYWFQRILEAKITEFDQKYMNDILHTSGNAFGYGYVDKDSIKVDEKHFAIVAKVQGEFAGFCFGHIQPAGDINSLLRLQPGVIPDDVRMANEHGSLGVLKTIAVRRKFQGHGIGTKLIKEAEAQLVKRGCECVLVPAWTVDGTTALRNLLVHNDYVEWIANDNFWKEACEGRAFECVSFNGSCRCSVTFFRKGRL